MPIRRLVLPLLILAAASETAQAAPAVAVDVAPLHSIVASVMAGVGEPSLILPPGASPHGYALRPSEAARLQSADVVFWVGPALTPWLAGPLDTLARQARVETLAEAPGLTLLPPRLDAAFEPHDEGHDHAAEAASEADPHRAALDPHLWLDPRNAAAMARAAAAVLAKVDPEHAARYGANAAGFTAEMQALERRIEARLAPLRDRPFVVFHDAYRYFENRFDIPAAGSIVLQEGVAPGAARVAQIRDRIRERAAVCAFSEPQFPPALLATVTEGIDMRLGTLDPLGASLEPGTALYPALLDGMAGDLAACLDG